MSLTLPPIAACRQQQGGNTCHLRTGVTQAVVVRETIQADIGR
jgi:hypothetical protein